MFVLLIHISLHDKITKSANWYIRSWLSDYISFSVYEGYCRHDTNWIMVTFMIAASALIKVSRLYGLCQRLHMKLTYKHCVFLYYIPMWIYSINVSEYEISFFVFIPGLCQSYCLLHWSFCENIVKYLIGRLMYKIYQWRSCVLHYLLLK